MLKQQLVKRILRTTFQEKMLLIYKIIALFGISLILIDSDLAYRFMIAENFIVVKFFFVFNFIVFVDDIILFSKNLITSSFNKSKTQLSSTHRINTDSEELHLEGLLVEDIVSFLFDTGGFKNSDFLDVFGKSNVLFKKVGDILEQKQILIRGEKNARLLNPNISMEECVEILSKNPIHKENDNYYSFN